MKEFVLFTKLFHDCQAKRNENGELVALGKNGQFEKVSVDWIANNLWHIGDLKKSPHNFLLNNCQNLIDKKIIRLDDFQIKTVGASGELIRKEFSMNKKSEVMIESARYYIGRERFIFDGESIPIENIKIVILDSKNAGIVTKINGAQKIKYVFSLLDDEERDKRKKEIEAKNKVGLRKKQITQKTIVSKKDMDLRLRPWLRTQDNPMRENESPEQYAERMAHIGDYGYLKKISDDFARETGLGIHKVLNWREQQWLAASAYDLEVAGKYPELLNFINKYKSEGLKSFLSCEFDIKNGRKILSIGEKLEKNDAQKVFTKINELVDLAEKENQELARMLLEKDKNTDMASIKFELLKKAQEIILRFSDKLNANKNNKKEINELLQELEKIKTDILFFKSVFRQIIKENQDMRISDFKDLELNFKIRSSEISGDDKETMRQIAAKNYSDPEERGIAFKGMEKGFENANTTFNILRHKGAIISFLRFDRKDDICYFGSFNTDSDFQQAAIGETVMKESLQTEVDFSHVPIEAHALPDKKITSKYVEEAGFIIEDIELNYLGTSKALFKIKRDDKINQRYKFRGEIKQEDKKFFEIMTNSGATTESGNPFLKIEADKINDTAVLEKIKNFMQKHKLVITRYFPDDKKNPKYYILAFETRISEPDKI